MKRIRALERLMDEERMRVCKEEWKESNQNDMHSILDVSIELSISSLFHLPLVSFYVSGECDCCSEEFDVGDVREEVMLRVRHRFKDLRV